MYVPYFDRIKYLKHLNKCRFNQLTYKPAVIFWKIPVQKLVSVSLKLISRLLTKINNNIEKQTFKKEYYKTDESIL